MEKHNVINGKEVAQDVIKDVHQDVAKLKELGLTPGLAVILVGENPASKIYVNIKKKVAVKAGMNSFVFEMDESVSTEDILSKIHELNKDQNVHGILVQLPLPKHIDSVKIINTIDPKKDVDGFTVENAGKLVTKQDALVPCTPQGCLHLIKHVQPNISGLHAVVIGRSNIVGKPMADLLLHENCSVTTIHSQTQNPEDIAKTADILVVAAGSPNLVDSNWVKEGAIVIDVGISRVNNKGMESLSGDVDFKSVQPIAGAITPVPGGVGPMTIAYLLKNTIKASYYYMK
jgi:methylenetetrahydrofolate dehydrogenase (NADP+)/methenyltetrahydrofolate cyclohydrolase